MNSVKNNVAKPITATRKPKPFQMIIPSLSIAKPQGIKFPATTP